MTHRLHTCLLGQKDAFADSHDHVSLLLGCLSMLGQRTCVIASDRSERSLFPAAPFGINLTCVNQRVSAQPRGTQQNVTFRLSDSVSCSVHHVKLFCFGKKNRAACSVASSQTDGFPIRKKPTEHGVRKTPEVFQGHWKGNPLGPATAGGLRKPRVQGHWRSESQWICCSSRYKRANPEDSFAHPYFHLLICYYGLFQS